MANLPTTNALSHFLSQDPLSIPTVDQPLAYEQLEEMSRGMYTNARKHMQSDNVNATGAIVRLLAKDIGYATTMMAYKPDVRWRKAGVSTAVYAKAGQRIMASFGATSKYTVADSMQLARSSVNAVTRMMANYETQFMAQEQSVRNDKLRRGLAMLVNDAETIYGMRGLADTVIDQSVSDLSSGAASFINKQIFQLGEYRLWKEYNDFDGQSEAAGYFNGGGLSELFGSNLPTSGGNAVSTE